MNPVFFFDELDKVSDTLKIEGISIISSYRYHQNSQFHDKYFSKLILISVKHYSYSVTMMKRKFYLKKMYGIKTKEYGNKEKLQSMTNIGPDC